MSSIVSSEEEHVTTEDMNDVTTIVDVTGDIDDVTQSIDIEAQLEPE